MIPLRPLLLTLLLTATLSAQAATKPDPADMVKATSEQVITALKDKKNQTEKRSVVFKLVDDIVLPHFDFTRMSQWVMSKHWRAMSPEQQQRFAQLFRDLLVRTYANSLTSYKNQKIDVSNSSSSDDGESTVKMVVRQGGGQADIPIVYKLYWTGDEWKVYDVTIDGVSLVTNYRASFGKIASQQGIDALFKQLEQRAKTASDKA